MGRRPCYRNERVSAPILLQCEGCCMKRTPATTTQIPCRVAQPPSKSGRQQHPGRIMLQRKARQTTHPLNSEPPCSCPPRPPGSPNEVNLLTGFPQGFAISFGPFLFSLVSFFSPALIISLACVCDRSFSIYIIESLSPPYTRRLPAPLPTASVPPLTQSFLFSRRAH